MIKDWLQTRYFFAPWPLSASQGLSASKGLSASQGLAQAKAFALAKACVCKVFRLLFSYLVYLIQSHKVLSMKIPLKQYLDLLSKYLKPQLITVGLLGFLLLGNITLQLINPQIIRNFIDAAQGGSSPDILTRSALLFLGLAIVQQIATILANYYSEIVAWTATNGLRVDLADHCLRLDLSFHNAHPPGEIIERIDGDVNNLANFFSRFVIEFLGNGLLLAGLLVMLWRENTLVGLGLTVFVGLSMFIMLRYRNVAVPHWAAERKASADFYSFLEERLAGTEDIRANGAEAYVLRRFNILIREMLRKSLKSAMVINVLININQFLFALGTAAAFAIGTTLFKDAVITLGTVYLVYHYTNMLNRPMDNIARQVEELQRAGAGMVRIQDLFIIKSRINGDHEPENPSAWSETNQLAPPPGPRYQRHPPGSIRAEFRPGHFSL